ncbi:MAG: hypothetical protein GY856_34095 [bacterium]|nr:hypothetical protein [bacterium]
MWLQGTRHRGTVLASSPSSLTVELPAAVPAGSHRVVVSRPLAGGPESGISDVSLEIRPAVAYQPGQEVYVTSYGSDRITVFEPGGGTDSIQVQHYGTGIVVTPDGSTGLVAQLDEDPWTSWDALPEHILDVTVFDLNPNSPTYRQAVADVPWIWPSFTSPSVTPGLDNPNGIFVYVPNFYMSDTVSVIDPYERVEVDLDGDPATQSIPLRSLHRELRREAAGAHPHRARRTGHRPQREALGRGRDPRRGPALRH